MLGRYVQGPRIDHLVARATGSAVYYYHQDALGSTVALTDESGSVVERYSYDVYGTPTFEDSNGNIISHSSIGNRLLFTGREYLIALELYDYRNHTYSARLGRFLQTDPIWFDGGDVNLYRYVANNVTDFTDPDGLLGEYVIWWTCTVTYELGKEAPCCSESVTGHGEGETYDEAYNKSLQNAKDAVPEGCAVKQYHNPACHRQRFYFFNGTKPA